MNRPAEVSYFLYFLTGQLLITAFEEEGMAGRTQELLENILSAQPELRQSEPLKRRMTEGVFTAMQAAITLKDLDTALACAEWGRTACQQLDFSTGECFLDTASLNMLTQLNHPELSRLVLGRLGRAVSSVAPVLSGQWRSDAITALIDAAQFFYYTEHDSDTAASRSYGAEPR